MVVNLHPYIAALKAQHEAALRDLRSFWEAKMAAVRRCRLTSG